MMNKDNLTPESNEELKNKSVEENINSTEDKKPEKKTKKSGKGKKKKVYSVEEILAEGGTDPNQVNADGKKQKIKVKTKSKLKRREAAMGYIFTAPWIIGVIVLMLYPMIRSLQFSLVKMSVTPRGIIIRGFAGLENYKGVLAVYQGLPEELATLFFRMALSVPVIVVFALLMALMLNLKIKGRMIFRTIFFLPVIVVSGPVMTQLTGEASTITAIDMSLIENIVYGALPGFLASAIVSVFSQIIIILWYSGVQILIFLAAIQKIDTSLYEAAKIDGGSGWECFWKITLPTIKPMILLNAVYTVIFLSADTNSNNIITRMDTLRFDARGGIAKASALGWMYSIVILLLVGLVALLLKQKRDIYAKQVAKQKRFEKKTRRQIAKSHKRMVANAKKFETYVDKQDKARAAGKKVKGGERTDD